MKILIIEDDYCFQVLIRGIILSVITDQVDIDLAETVEEALTQLDKSIDLVVSDYQFPGGNFPAILERITSLNLDYIVSSSLIRKDILPERFISKSNLLEGLRKKLQSKAA